MAHFISGYSTDSSTNLGLARRPGACSSTHGCSYSLGAKLGYSSFQTAFTMAHEIGHNVDMHHDGQADGDSESCDGSCCIMSPTSNFASVAWSTCSSENFQTFLQSETCLDNSFTPDPYEQYPGVSDVTVEEQCIAVNGPCYAFRENSAYVSNCGFLPCITATSKFYTSIGFRVEGSYCGADMVWVLN